MDGPSWDSIIDIAWRWAERSICKVAPPAGRLVRKGYSKGRQVWAPRLKRWVNEHPWPTTAVLSLPLVVTQVIYAVVRWDEIQTSAAEASGIRAAILCVMCLLTYLAVAVGGLMFLYRGGRKLKEGVRGNGVRDTV